jgi:hypothetical protein
MNRAIVCLSESPTHTPHDSMVPFRGFERTFLVARTYGISVVFHLSTCLSSFTTACCAKEWTRDKDNAGEAYRVSIQFSMEKTQRQYAIR